MMTEKPFRTSVVEAICTSLAISLLSLFVQHIALGKGILIVDDQIETPTGTYVPVKVVNHSESILYGLRLLVPSYVQLSDITASFPVKVSLGEDNTGSSEEKEVVVNDIKPEATTVLTIFCSKRGGYVTPVNVHDVGLSQKDKDEIQSPLKSSLEYAAPSGVFYFIIFCIFNFASRRRLRAQSEMKAALEKDIERQQIALEKVTADLQVIQSESKKTLDNIKSRMFRLRFYLEAQLSATRRELDFWRNTVRKVLYQSGSSKEGVEEVLKAISQNLSTQLTHKHADDADHLQTAMEVLLEHQKPLAIKHQAIDEPRA